MMEKKCLDKLPKSMAVAVFQALLINFPLLHKLMVQVLQIN